MPGLDFKGPAVREQEAQSVIAYNTRLGVILFCLYLVFYGGFMALSAFFPQAIRQTVRGGVNVGIVYGFALILAAFFLAMLYLWLCRKPSHKSR